MAPPQGRPPTSTPLVHPRYRDLHYFSPLVPFWSYFAREERIYQGQTFWVHNSERLRWRLHLPNVFILSQHHLGFTMFWEDITLAWGTPQGRPHLSSTYMWVRWHLGMVLIHHPRHQKLPASVSSSAMAMSMKGRQAEEEEEGAGGLDSMRWWWWWHGMAMHLKPSRWCNPTTVVVRGDWEEIGGGDDACGVGRYRNC